MTIEATTVVSFNTTDDTADYVFNLLLDDTLNLDSDGEPKTSFYDTDSAVYLLANKSTNVTIDQVLTTSGSIKSLGQVSRDKSETNLFTSLESAADDSYTIQMIPSSVDADWIGNTGAVEGEISDIGITSYIPDIRLTPFLCEFSYYYSCDSYKFTPPSMSLSEDETFQVGIVFYITVVD